MRFEEEPRMQRERFQRRHESVSHYRTIAAAQHGPEVLPAREARRC
jgi:hypothetical protein